MLPQGQDLVRHRPHVVTVDDVFRPDPPCIRTQTFAFRLETSIPAHRGCMTSMTHTSSSPGHRNDQDVANRDVFRGGRKKYRTLTCVLTGNNPRFPRTTTVPSTTKLTHRLTAPQTDRGQPEHPEIIHPPAQTANSGNRDRT